MPQPDELPPHNPKRRKKMDDECVLTIHLMNGTVRQFAFHESSPFRSWHLSPMVISPKDTLTISYRNGERIHFPLCNIESYHVAPRTSLKIEDIYSMQARKNRGEVTKNAEAPPTVHD